MPATRSVARVRQPPVELVSVDEVIRRHVIRVLEVCAGDRTTAAYVLGIDRKTLERKLRRWGL